MPAYNDITGAPLVSKTSSAFRDNYDAIFRKPNRLYLDLDGVFVDIDKWRLGRFGADFKSVAPPDFWKAISEVPAFFEKLEKLPDADRLWTGIQEIVKKQGLKQEILSAIPRPTPGLESCGGDKKTWVRTNLCDTITVNVVEGGKNKDRFANSRAILIDDLPRNIDAWTAAGGIGILHVSVDETLKQLAALFGE